MRWPLIALLLLAGCAGPHPRSSPSDTGAGADRCAALYAAVDSAVAEAGVRDGQAARVAGFPYLRVDRFLASFRDETTEPATFTAWVDRLRRLDRTARGFELANLPAARRDALARQWGDLHRRLAACAETLRAADLADARGRAVLRQRARVPDEYRTMWRLLGLYPLTAPLVRAGMERWLDELETTFERPLGELPVTGTLRRYRPRGAAPLGPAKVAALVADSADNALDIPEPRGPRLEALFARFAPVFEVDTVGPADRIGRMRVDRTGRPWVATDRPRVYRHLSHTRFRGRALLQLNYIAWFPARPKTGRFDLFGGHLDGLRWRVTLGPDGRPWLYEAVHSCGCYHMFFPASPLRVRQDLPNHPWYEPPRVPQSAPETASNERLVLRLAQRTHMVQRLYADKTEAGTPYASQPYAALRSLPLGEGGRASLFDPQGLIPSSRRLESLLLWPMGIPLPGGMRQWGHHAIAFVGRRHLDDPHLLEKLFERHSAFDAKP